MVQLPKLLEVEDNTLNGKSSKTYIFSCLVYQIIAETLRGKTLNLYSYEDFMEKVNTNWKT